MTPLQHAQNRLEEARAAHATLLNDFESRINGLSDNAATADVDRLHDDFSPRLDEAEALVKRCQTQLDTTERLARGREASGDLIQCGGDEHEGRSFRVREGRTYDLKSPHGPSFFRDLWNAQHGSRDAVERLERHNKEAIAHAEKRGLPFRDAEGRALNSSSGTGGDYLPPIWDFTDAVLVPRSKRVTALLVRQEQLVAYGNVIDIPKFTGATDAANIQSADNANLQASDGATSLLTATVFTVGGNADLSRQALERAPGLDATIYRDLVGDIDKKLNAAVLNGTSVPVGLLQQAGTATVAFTTGSPSVQLFWPKLWDAIQRVQTAVFEQPSAIVVHPRRFAWMCAAVDGQQRPLVLPTSAGPMNAMGVVEVPADSQFGGLRATPAGVIGNYPVYTDAGLPVNGGAGTNQDTCIVAAFQESILWTDGNGIRSFSYEAILSASAGIRLQCLLYAAFSAARLPSSISLVQGTGMSPPGF